MKSVLGAVDISSVVGKVSISSKLGVDVITAGPINIVGSAIVLSGKASGPVGGFVLCASDLHPLIRKALWYIRYDSSHDQLSNFLKIRQVKLLFALRL